MANSPSNPFIKQLAANDRPTRDRAVSSLRTYLKRSTPFTPLDLLKLWKGLFYCMWMSDRARTQQRLALDLSSLLSILTPANFLGFSRAFWETMTREWAGIDSLRMDKFLFLVRCYVREGFAYLSRNAWADAETRREYLDILAEGPLDPKDVRVPGGLRYHVVDIFVEELDKVDVERSAPVEELVGPLRKVAKEGLTKALRKKAEEALDDGRLEDWQNAHDGEEEEEGDVPQHETEGTLTNDGDHKHETGGLAALEDGDEFEGFDD